MHQTPFNVQIIELNFTEAKHSASQLERQLAEAGVLCLRMRQKLSKEEFFEIRDQFGGVKDPVGKTKNGESYQYSPIRQAIDSGWVPTEEDRQKYDLNFGGLDENRPGLFETYHCDDTFAEQPAQYTILHARALPPSGGGPTQFMDMRGAYTKLSDQERADLHNYTVHYAYDNSVGGKDPFPPRKPAKDGGDCLMDVSHPMVRRHPITDNLALFIDLDRATHIDQLQPDDGRSLLKDLQSRAENEAPKCEHHWQDYDVLLWDNASVQHRASGNFKVGEPRRFWRLLAHGTTVFGPKPYTRAT